MDLNALIEAATGEADAEARKRAVRAALAEHSLDLADLEQNATSRFAELAEPGESGYTDEAITQMGVIADVVEAIRDEAQDRAVTAARVAELTDRIGSPVLPTGETLGSSEESTEQSPAEQPSEPAAAEQSAAETVAEPAADTSQPAAPASEPEVPAVSAETAAPAAEQASETPAAAPEKELVVAAAKRPARVQPQVSLDTLPKQLPAQKSAGTHAFNITAAADLPGYNLGAELDLDNLTSAVMARFQQLNRAGGDAKGSRAGIASINIDRSSEFVAETQHDWHVIERACDETRLPGGSLLASIDTSPAALTATGPLEPPAPTPGWCAPCEPSYEFCPIAQVYGTIDLPTVTARRGCITWPQSPSFHEIYSSIGWCFTPEQIDNMQSAEPNPDIGPAEKPCYKITCPPNEDLVLEPCGLCIQASLLHERAYPELIRYVVQQALVAHAHKMNCRVLSSMESQATPVTLPAEGAGNFGPGATAYTLEAIELQVEWLRYRHRLGLDTTIEMVAPAWMRGILRADLSKRMGVDMLSVTNQMLVSYLALRGVRVQFVVDWQDAFCDAENSAIPDSPMFGGGTAPQTAWPESVKILLYPAGTYFMARMDIINLEGGLLDSTLLRKNERMVLFTEEAMAVGKRCYESLAVEIPLCPSGQTGSGAWVNCATAPKAPAGA